MHLIEVFIVYSSELACEKDIVGLLCKKDIDGLLCEEDIIGLRVLLQLSPSVQSAILLPTIP